jgi:GMP synthase-like glutamine amidotransferase
MMGGPMSVNDDLPWIEPLLALIRQAQASAIPMLGHFLGGQLIAKALGATHLLASSYCENQAFAIGKTLAMQCQLRFGATQLIF